MTLPHPYCATKPAFERRDELTKIWYEPCLCKILNNHHGRHPTLPTTTLWISIIHTNLATMHTSCVRS